MYSAKKGGRRNEPYFHHTPAHGCSQRASTGEHRKLGTKIGRNTITLFGVPAPSRIAVWSDEPPLTLNRMTTKLSKGLSTQCKTTRGTYMRCRDYSDCPGYSNTLERRSIICRSVPLSTESYPLIVEEERRAQRTWVEYKLGRPSRQQSKNKHRHKQESLTTLLSSSRSSLEV